jgi:hypothetical protein
MVSGICQAGVWAEENTRDAIFRELSSTAPHWAGLATCCPSGEGEIRAYQVPLSTHNGLTSVYPPEIEPVYIPELTYLKDSDYDNSGSINPVINTFWS